MQVNQIHTLRSGYADTCQTVEPSPETKLLPQLWENKATDVFLGLFPKRKCECVRDRDRKNGGPQHSHSNLNHRKISWDFLAVQNFSGHWSLIDWIFCVLVTGTKLASYWVSYEGSWLCFTNLISKTSISTSFFLPLWFCGFDLPETSLDHSQESKFCNAWKFRNSCNHVCIGYLCYNKSADNKQNSDHVSKHYSPRIKYNTIQFAWMEPGSSTFRHVPRTFLPKWIPSLLSERKTITGISMRLRSLVCLSFGSVGFIKCTKYSL